jgi:transposase-like protein
MSTKQTVYRILKERYAPLRKPLPRSLSSLQRRKRKPMKSFQEVVAEAGRVTSVILSPRKDADAANRLTKRILSKKNKQLEATTNAMGLSSSTHGSGNIDTFDPLLRKKPIRRRRKNGKTNPAIGAVGNDGGGDMS